MSKKKLPDHIEGIVGYLSDPSEKANEDLIIKYFRKVWGSSFTRQKEAKRADGYVQGTFVLELKGKKADWISGFFQGIAYSKELDFSQIIVATRNYLSVWNLKDLDACWVEDALTMKGAPSSIGKKLATKYKKHSRKINEKAIWSLSLDFEGGLLSPTNASIQKEFTNFERAVKAGKKTRKKITTKNFHTVLKEMKAYFETDKPIRTVRAFYNLIFSWDEASIIEISQKNTTQATLKGESIEHLIPGKRILFKKFIEDHQVFLSEGENIDDFFALYDKAIDAVDPNFRVKNGIFFTDLNLSKLAMWFVKRELGDIGKNYLVVDPACGSGNLVTNWRSPLELRHKVVSEIEPELLYTVEQRMKGDMWHNGKFTVVPKVTENKGLNFLDKSAEEYLGFLETYIKDKGHTTNKPIAFLCNPPYRSDDDQSADSITYDIHKSIVDLIGNDCSKERSSCFLAQMKLICSHAKESGFPEESLLMLFTGTSWLSKREIYKNIRNEIFENFEDVGGFLVNSKEFFDVKGTFPIAFTVWKYKPNAKNLDADRPIELVDLTNIKKNQLENINWNHFDSYNESCEEIFKNKTDSPLIALGSERGRLCGEWLGLGRKNLYRNLTKEEKKLPGNSHMGVPKGDKRHKKKTVYGYEQGKNIGFLLDLTPCRTFVEEEYDGKPWFHLDSRFMRVNTNRIFSGLPDSRAYCAIDFVHAERLFSWFSLARTFASCGYPMWANASDMWPARVKNSQREKFNRFIFSIGFAENDCLETYFPANNPTKNSEELYISNPLSPIIPNSFWNSEIEPNVVLTKDNSSELINKIKEIYDTWKKEVGAGNELHVSYKKSYFINDGVLSEGAGLTQIKDYARELGIEKIETLVDEMNELLKKVKNEFKEFIISDSGLNYFGVYENSEHVSENEKQSNNVLEFKARTPFEKVLEKRLALVSKIIEKLPNDSKLNRVKIAKAVYLCDMYTEVDLKTNYVREAAGPLDQRFFYNEKIGVDSIGRSLDLFTIEHKKLKKGEQYRYRAGKNLESMSIRFDKLFKKDAKKIDKILELMSQMDYEQSEIFATVYACWNDLILSKKKVTERTIVTEFLNKWHPEKTQYDEERIVAAITWMKANKIIPKGRPPKVTPKVFKEAIPF